LSSNTTNSIRAVIFDLDGTLVDTAGEIATAMNRTMDELRLRHLPADQVTNLIGRGVRSMVERALPLAGGSGVDVDHAVEKFEAHYAQTVGTAAELFPGVLPGLVALRAAQLKMSVVTNKPRFFTQRLLDRLQVTGFLSGVVAGDDGIRRKPHGDMLEEACRQMGSPVAQSLMVGDSQNDILAARAAGCPVWCVPYGYNEGNPAYTLRCDRLVATVEEVAKALAAK
jgi:phosphoglycolate phosphatase